MTDVNSFSIGKQCTLVIQHPLATGGRLDLSIITDFDAKPTNKDLMVDGLDGINRTQFLPQHVVITFSLDRADPTADAFGAALEKAYFDGSGFVPSGTVFQYIQESNGSTTTYQYEGVALKVDDFGSWKGDSAVKQKLTGHAQRRRVA